MTIENKAYVHVYTGNGKGKTTSALGLALRAFGAGKRVFIGQFVKGKKYSEVEVIEKYLDGINIEQFGLECFIYKDPEDADIKAAKDGLEKVKDIIYSGKYDLVIMDELNIALYFNLFDINEVLDILDNRPANVELVITGRYAPEQLIERADLVTEMKEVKHYYNNGVEARKGIEM